MKDSSSLPLVPALPEAINGLVDFLPEFGLFCCSCFIYLFVYLLKNNLSNPENSELLKDDKPKG